MSALTEIVPERLERIIDLVRDAGVDVSDWSNFKGGEAKAASNPKYCYAWSFIEPKKVVVLSLWYTVMQVQDNIIFQQLNMRERARPLGRPQNDAVWKKRALNVDEAVRIAFHDRLPIRVIVCDGERRNSKDFQAKASKVRKRILDPVPWVVTSYDGTTGQFTVTRGAFPNYVDQFAIDEYSVSQVERRSVSGQVYVRNPEVRKRVLNRAQGKCELCFQPGFIMANGDIYLETHHVIPLSEHGDDRDKNVVALCSNHHREAHYGKDRSSLRQTLLEYLAHIP